MAKPEATLDVSDPTGGSVPPTLRTWFRVHCAIDVIAAIPLLLFPGKILGLLGWTAVDPVTTRLCGAALMGIGTASIGVHQYGIAGYRALLGLKVVWSVSAIFALFAAIGDGAPPAAWAFLSIFIAFSGVWMSYAIRLRQMSRAGLSSNGDEQAAADDDRDNDSDNDNDNDDRSRSI